MTRPPAPLSRIEAAARRLRFEMSIDARVGELLRTLAASQHGGRVLELGTGVGASTAWIREGLPEDAELVTLDCDPQYTDVAREILGGDRRLTILTTDGGAWLTAYAGPPFDLIFADTWPGKYTHLEAALRLLRPGGIYLIDDMLPQPNWPEGHAAKAAALRAHLRERDDLTVTEMDYATGIILAVKSA